MPTHNYRKLRWLRDLCVDARASGLPCSTLDVPFTLWRSRGRSTLLHANNHECLVSHRKLVSPVQWSGTVADALADRHLCDCARSTTRFGAAGAWLATFDQLRTARRLFDRLLADPEPVRFPLLCATEQRLAHASRELQRPGATELVDTVDEFRGGIADFDATVVADWRARADDPGSWVWFAAGLPQHTRHPFAAFVREHGTLGEWVARGNDATVAAAEWSRLCDEVGDPTPRPWVHRRARVGELLSTVLRQCDALDVRTGVGRMLAGLFPDVVTELFIAQWGAARSMHRLPDDVGLAGCRLAVELWDPDRGDLDGDVAEIAALVATATGSPR